MHVDVSSVMSLFLASPFLAIAVILSVFLLRRVRWVRTTRTGRKLFGIQPSAVGLGMAFLFLQTFWQPSLCHAIEAREKVDVEEDDEGDPETPEKQLNRQLKRIRRGEVVDRLVLRL
jgi:L-lactate permease